jgi:hypothetical protein
MKRLAAVLLIVSAALVVLADAAAARLPRTPFQLLQAGIAALDPYKIPPEWDGIWVSTDSTYDCNGGFQQVDSSTDTLCAGAVFFDPNVITGEVECTGSFTATTLNITCTGVDTIITDCVGTFTYNIRGTRTGDDAFLVVTIETSFDGSAPECGFIPDDCSQLNSQAQRTGPAPAAYCATPSRPSTWGEVKIRYR